MSETGQEGGTEQGPGTPDTPDTPAPDTGGDGTDGEGSGDDDGE